MSAPEMIRAQADTVWFEYREEPDTREGYRRYWLDLKGVEWGLLNCSDGGCIISPVETQDGWARSDLFTMDHHLDPVSAAKIILGVMRGHWRGYSEGYAQRGKEIRAALHDDQPKEPK